MRTLVIHAYPAQSYSIELILTSREINVSVADNGEDGIYLAKQYDHDIIIVDQSLPDMTGVEIVRRLQHSETQSPILVLCGDKSVETKVGLLAAGADDCLTKPFHHEELVARLYALVRRSRGYAVSKIAVGAVTVNLPVKRAEANGRPITLTGMEYRVLELLILRRGKTISKQEIYEYLYAEDDQPLSRTIELFICRLRKKLVAATGTRCIETVGRSGYVVPA